jgi:hypothetical protein
MRALAIMLLVLGFCIASDVVPAVAQHQHPPRAVVVPAGVSVASKQPRERQTWRSRSVRPPL